MIYFDFGRQSERRSREKEVYLERSRYQAKDGYLILLIEVSFVRCLFEPATIVQSFSKFGNVL